MPLREKASDSLYLKDRMSDVNFLFYEKNTENVDSKKLIEKVPAHKLILASASPVFEAEFYGLIKENGDIDIVDSSPEAFKEFLQCFYLGAVTFTMKNIPEIMNLANKYDVSDCMDACVQFFTDNFTEKDIWLAYELANLHEHKKLKKFCEKHIVNSSDTVLKSDEFLDCDKKSLHEILKLDLNSREITVFNRCLAWAKNACQQNGLDENNFKNLRNQLGDCLYLIRFGTMTIHEFSTLNCDGIFTTVELKDIIRSISSKGYVSMKFNQNLRQKNSSKVEWNESRVLIYNSIFGESVGPVQSSEIVFITTNKTTLLGGIYLAPVWYNEDINFSLNVSFSITEIQGKSVSSETGSILFSDTKKIFFHNQAYIKPPTPLIINSKNMYRLCFNFGKNLLSMGCHLGEIKSETDLIVTFKGENGKHMIAALELYY